MTTKRFTDVEVDKYYGLICMNHDGQFHSYSEQSLEDLLNHLHEENQRLKSLLSLQEEVVTDAIDNLMELPSVSKYLIKQWLECAEKYDSIEELQNEFKERLIELEDLE